MNQNHTRQTPALLKLAALALLVTPGLHLAGTEEFTTMGPSACMGEGAEGDTLLERCAGMSNGWFGAIGRHIEGNLETTMWVLGVHQDTMEREAQEVQDQLP